MSESAADTPKVTVVRSRKGDEHGDHSIHVLNRAGRTIAQFTEDEALAFAHGFIDLYAGTPLTPAEAERRDRLAVPWAYR